MGGLLFLCDHNPLFDFGFRDDERVSKGSALKELLPVKILPKMSNRVNLRYEGKLLNAWVFKEIVVLLEQLPNYGLVESEL